MSGPTAQNRRDSDAMKDRPATRGGWNYRVFRHEDAEGAAVFIIHEAYYENGQVAHWTEDGVAPIADAAEDMLNVLGMMAQATLRPVLDGVTGKELAPTVVPLEHHEINEGDVVRRRGGGPFMIAAIADKGILGEVQCLWFGDGNAGRRRLQNETYQGVDLEIVARRTSLPAPDGANRDEP